MSKREHDLPDAADRGGTRWAGRVLDLEGDSDESGLIITPARKKGTYEPDARASELERERQTDIPQADNGNFHKYVLPLKI